MQKFAKSVSKVGWRPKPVTWVDSQKHSS